MSDTLFSLDDVPEVPLLPEPRRRKGAARGSSSDSRFQNDYPPEWGCCPTCEGDGRAWGEVLRFGLPAPRDIAAGEPVRLVWTNPEVEKWGYIGDSGTAVGYRLRDATCPDCLGMGSLKARVRLAAGHRCARCKHPYMPRGDAKMLDVEPSGMHDCEDCGGSGHLVSHSTFGSGSVKCGACKGRGKVWAGWSACDEWCDHGTPVRWKVPGQKNWQTVLRAATAFEFVNVGDGIQVEAEWRVLTVHHLDGDKANCRWWNLAALCQRCHLEIQGKVVMERVYPHEHSEWFKPYVAGYYAFVYLCGTCGDRVEKPPHPPGFPYPHPGQYPPKLIVPDAVTVPEGIAVANLWDYPHRCEPGLEITREQALAHMDELLNLERIGGETCR